VDSGEALVEGFSGDSVGVLLDDGTDFGGDFAFPFLVDGKVEQGPAR
jgi:hypothetical protein